MSELVVRLLRSYRLDIVQTVAYTSVLQVSYPSLRYRECRSNSYRRTMYRFCSPCQLPCLRSEGDVLSEPIDKLARVDEA